MRLVKEDLFKLSFVLLNLKSNNEKNKMLQRIGKMGGKSMLSNQNQPSAFATPLPPHLTVLSDDDSINNEFIQNVASPPPRSVIKNVWFFYFE